MVVAIMQKLFQIISIVQFISTINCIPSTPAHVSLHFPLTLADVLNTFFGKQIAVTKTLRLLLSLQNYLGLNTNLFFPNNNKNNKNNNCQFAKY